MQYKHTCLKLLNKLFYPEAFTKETMQQVYPNLQIFQWKMGGGSYSVDTLIEIMIRIDTKLTAKVFLLILFTNYSIIVHFESRQENLSQTLREIEALNIEYSELISTIG